MSWPPAFALVCVAGLLSWWLTGRFRDYALARQLLDIPNSRSSHAVATPRGGGMAMVVATVTALPLLGVLGAVSWAHLIGLLGGTVIVALVGFADDHGHVAPLWRLVAHAAAAIWILWWLGAVPPLVLFGVALDLGWAGYALALLYVVWLVNLTNFMDGIDGIAAAEAITVTLGGVLTYLVSVPGDTWWLGPLLLASVALGFLVWNWPPAKIFMGDAGSGFVGLMLAALSLQAAGAAPQLLWSWIILLGVFVIDATVTLVRRIARRERVHEAHRSHAYQHASRRWAAHRPVTVAVVSINLLWLLPMAMLVARGQLDGMVAMVVAYAPLVAVALWLKAGVPSAA